MAVAYESWGANAPAYPELVVSFPDGRSIPCGRTDVGPGPAPCSAAALLTQGTPTSLTRNIELGGQLVALIEESGEFDLARRGPKPNSLRALAARMQQVIPASSMWRAVAIHQLWKQHPELTTYRHLGVGHLSVLLTLRGQLRLGLMRKAERLTWSRRKLQAVVGEIKQAPQRNWTAELDLEPYLAEA